MSGGQKSNEEGPIGPAIVEQDYSSLRELFGAPGQRAANGQNHVLMEDEEEEEDWSEDDNEDHIHWPMMVGNVIHF